MSDKPSAAWYLAPIFLGIIGSAIMWYVLKDEDHPDSPKMVKKGWVIGIVLTIIPFLMLIPMLVLIPMTSTGGFDQQPTQDRMEVIPEPRVIAVPPPTQEQCQAIGGMWGLWSNAVDSAEQCNPPTTDQGAECTESSQCQSYCQAKGRSEIDSNDSGNCYGFEFALCMQEVRNGVVQPEWCQ